MWPFIFYKLLGVSVHSKKKTTRKTRVFYTATSLKNSGLLCFTTANRSILLIKMVSNFSEAEIVEPEDQTTFSSVNNDLSLRSVTFSQ